MAFKGTLKPIYFQDGNNNGENENKEEKSFIQRNKTALIAGGAGLAIGVAGTVIVSKLRNKAEDEVEDEDEEEAEEVQTKKTQKKADDAEKEVKKAAKKKAEVEED